jgi:kynurenine formamidase
MSEADASSEAGAVPAMRELLGEDTPTNWGKWGPDDELGCLNYLDAKEVLRGVQHVRSGDVFTLQIHMGRRESPGDPLWPGREGIKRQNVMDEATWDGEGAPAFPGGLHYADDTALIFLQGSTQYDALGHVWYDGKLWNGYDARSTVDAMDKASVLPIAEKGVVGRGVLIDMARHRGKQWLDKGETFDHNDLQEAAAAQNTTIEPHDILYIRTGFMKYWYDLDDQASFYDGFNEPGLTYSRELVEWFQRMEIPNLVTDTIANEVTYEPGTGVALPLHCALMRNLGVALTEITWLDDLAAACAEDGRWSFLYAAAPLKVVNGTGAPVNPIAIR